MNHTGSFWTYLRLEHIVTTKVRWIHCRKEAENRATLLNTTVIKANSEKQQRLHSRPSCSENYYNVLLQNSELYEAFICEKFVSGSSSIFDGVVVTLLTYDFFFYFLQPMPAPYQLLLQHN